MRWGDIAAFLVVLAGGVLSSWLVDRIFPLHRILTADLGALSAKYRRWQLQLMGVWLLVLLPAVSVGAWRLLTRLAKARHAKLGRFEIAFFPGVIEWGLVALFLGAVISMLLLWMGVRIYLGPRYDEYRLYETLQWGIGTGTTWLSVIVLSAGASLLAAAMLDWCAVFTVDRIHINDPFSAERTYRYEYVVAIRTAPKWIALVGNEVERREYVVCFRDGSSWSTTWAPGVVSQRDRRRLAEFISAKSEAPVAELPVLTRKHQSCH